MTRPKGRFYKRKAGGQPTHGAWAIIHREEFVQAHPEIVNYGKDFYDGKLAELSRGGREPSVSELLLLDRIHAQVITVSLIDSYVARSGVLRHDQLQAKPPMLTPWPIMELWMSLNRSIQSGLLALGLEPKPREPLVLSPFELAAEVVKDAEREERKKAAVPAPGGENASRTDPQDTSAMHSPGRGEENAPGFGNMDPGASADEGKEGGKE